jgi:hypothetical protein
MNRFFSFLRSELFLSIAGGFALGFAGMALVKPASASLERQEARAVVVETTASGAYIHGNDHAR